MRNIYQHVAARINWVAIAMGQSGAECGVAQRCCNLIIVNYSQWKQTPAASDWQSYHRSIITAHY